MATSDQIQVNPHNSNENDRIQDENMYENMRTVSRDNRPDTSTDTYEARIYRMYSYIGLRERALTKPLSVKQRTSCDKHEEWLKDYG